MSERSTIVRGDDYEWFIRLTDTDGNALPLRDVEIVITAKPPGTDDADDSDALYRHTATFDAAGGLTGANGIRLGGDDPNGPGVFSSPDDGVVTEFLTPADILALAAQYDQRGSRGERVIAEWDMQVRDAQGRRKTVQRGSFTMTRDIGRFNG